ncbi:MAG: BamA/TamA family outer membrane protein [Candidatus Krumholzibacteriia bacterium]
MRLTLITLLLCTGVLAAAPGWARSAADATPASVREERPLRIEPGLEARRRRFAAHPVQKAAMVPVRLIELPFVIVNYPFEHWFVRKKPILPLVVTQGVLANLAARGLTIHAGGLGTGSGSGGGLAYRLPPSVTGPVNLRVFGGATHAGYEQYFAQLDSLDLGRLRLRARVQFFDQPEEDLFGIGLTSRKEDRATYELETTSGMVEGLTRLTSRWQLGLRLAFTRTDVGRGEDEEFLIAQDVFPGIAGLRGRYDFLKSAASLAWDGRDNPAYARRGTYARVRVDLADGVRDTDIAYTKYALELQQFLPLPGVRRTLAMRLYGVVTDNRSSGDLEIPVFRLERLGGSTTMRGLQDFRFTDKDLLVGNIEYRFPFWFIEHESGIAIDALAFFDFGTVMPNLEDVQQRDLRSSVGFGFRVVTHRSMLFRLDVGWTSGDSRLDLGIRGPI